MLTLIQQIVMMMFFIKIGQEINGASLRHHVMLNMNWLNLVNLIYLLCLVLDLIKKGGDWDKGRDIMIDLLLK